MAERPTGEPPPKPPKLIPKPLRLVFGRSVRDLDFRARLHADPAAVGRELGLSDEMVEQLVAHVRRTLWDAQEGAWCAEVTETTRSRIGMEVSDPFADLSVDELVDQAEVAGIWAGHRMTPLDWKAIPLIARVLKAGDMTGGVRDLLRDRGTWARALVAELERRKPSASPDQRATIDEALVKARRLLSNLVGQ